MLTRSTATLNARSLGHISHISPETSCCQPHNQGREVHHRRLLGFSRGVKKRVFHEDSAEVYEFAVTSNDVWFRVARSVRPCGKMPRLKSLRTSCRPMFTNIQKYCFNTSNGTEIITVSTLFRPLKILFLKPPGLAILQLSQARSALKIAILRSQQRPAW